MVIKNLYFPFESMVAFIGVNSPWFVALKIYHSAFSASHFRILLKVGVTRHLCFLQMHRDSQSIGKRIGFDKKHIFVRRRVDRFFDPLGFNSQLASENCNRKHAANEVAYWENERVSCGASDLSSS